MADVALRKVSKRFGSFTAVNGLDLDVADGEFVAILGPSGCGKTTTMNMIAGIEAADAGSISFDGVDVTRAPIGKRGVGFVFQNYAIFTHMSVRDNLAFGLQVRGVRGQELERRVQDMAEFMSLSARLDEPSSRLSVNELQKLAVGRSAIVEPRIFLLDEPLSNLDADFRERMRSDLRLLQRRLKQTMIYVTHDQVEAMALADRIAVMNQGRLQQLDSPARIFSTPANAFVARFIGAPSMNILHATLAPDGPRATLRLGGQSSDAIELNDALALAARSHNSTELLFGFRPEALALRGEPGAGVVGADVAVVERLGRRTIVHFTAGLLRFVGAFGREFPLRAGERAHLSIDLGACHLFDLESERRLSTPPELLS